MVMKTYKIRIYPNQIQRQQLKRNFGARRFVWNAMVAMQNQRYDNGGKYVNEYGMNYLLKPLKEEYPWLKEAESTSLLNVDHNVHLAFKRFFKLHSGHPKFKSKRFAKPAYKSNVVNNNVIIVDARHIRLPKLGIMPMRTGRLPDGKLKTVTIVCDMCNKYYALVTAELVIEPLPKTSKIVGIDVGIADLVITSDGLKYPTKRFDKLLARKMHYWEKRVARRRLLAMRTISLDKSQGNGYVRQLSDFKNYMRAEQMVAKYNQKIANRRRNYLQNISKQLVQANDVIKLEDLKAKNLLGNHHLARAIANQSWRELRTMLEYKAEWYGKTVIAVAPYKTSQICSACGYDDGAHELGVREWTCPLCHAHHDRDVNAAKNILSA